MCLLPASSLNLRPQNLHSILSSICAADRSYVGLKLEAPPPSPPFLSSPAPIACLNIIDCNFHFGILPPAGFGGSFFATPFLPLYPKGLLY